MTLIELEEMVKNDLPNVRKIIANPSGMQTAIKPVNLYTLVADKLSDQTRLTSEQLSYLDAYEQALSVFRNSARELRTVTDTITLEQRINARNYSMSGKSSVQLQGLQSKLADAIMFSNRYALYFAGHVGLSLLGSEVAGINKLKLFGPEYDTSNDNDKLSRAIAKENALDFEENIANVAGLGHALTDENLKYALEGIFTSWVKQFSWDTYKDVVKEHSLEGLRLAYGSHSVEDGEFS